MKRLLQICKWKYLPLWLFKNRRLVTTSTAPLREKGPCVKQRPANHTAASGHFECRRCRPAIISLKQRSGIGGAFTWINKQSGPKKLWIQCSSFAVIERNKVPSLLLAARGPELTQEKQLLERLSHRHWKAISMRVGIGGHLWPHALSWHEVALAIACQFPPTPGFTIPLPSSRPSYLALFLPPPSPNPPLNVPGCWPLTEGGEEKKYKAICSVQSHKVEGVQSCNVFHQTGTDCWYFKGRNASDFGTADLFRPVKGSRLTLWLMLWKFEPDV